MKSALLFTAVAVFLVGAPPSQAARNHRQAHRPSHIRMHGENHSRLHLESATRSRHRRSTLKRARYATHSRGGIAPAIYAGAKPSLQTALGSPMAITGLPLPPSGAPEFGTQTSYAPLPERSIRVETVARSISPQPAHLKPSLPTQPAEIAFAAPQAPVVSGASLSGPSAEPLNPQPLAMAVPEPEVLPAPIEPHILFNQPNPVPLPEPSGVNPATETPRTILPEHEDDDQPMAATSGLGYIGLARVNRTRPFPTLTPMHGYDVAASGTGVFLHTVDTAGIQSANPTAGLFLTLHRQTDHWWDIEAHYGLNRSTNQFAATAARPALSVPVLSQEFSAGLLLRRHLNRARPYQVLPYLGVGGGLLLLRPSSSLASFSSKFAPAGLIDSGVDIPTNNQHLSFRIGSHLLLYRSPSFGDTVGSSFAISAQPAAGVLFHF